MIASEAPTSLVKSSVVITSAMPTTSRGTSTVIGGDAVVVITEVFVTLVVGTLAVATLLAMSSTVITLVCTLLFN